MKPYHYLSVIERSGYLSESYVDKDLFEEVGSLWIITVFDVELKQIFNKSRGIE